MPKTMLILLFSLSFLLNGSVLFVVNSGSETLSRIDLETGTVNNAFAVLGDMPNRLACNTQYIYIVNSGDNSVQKIDITTGATLTDIYLGTTVSPYDLIIDQDFLYVSGGLSSQVYKIDLATDTVIDQVAVGCNPAGMAIAANKLYVGNTAYMENYSNCSVSVIDLDSFEVLSTIPSNANPQYLLATGNQIHVSCTGNYMTIQGSIQIIATGSDVIYHTIEMGGWCGDLAITPAGIVYVADIGNDNVYAYDASNWELLYSPYNPFITGGYFVETDETNLVFLGGGWGQAGTVSRYDLEETFLEDYQVGLSATDIKFQPEASPVADNEIITIPSLQAYPNPFSDTINFRLNGSRSWIQNICIYDVKGRLIKKISDPQNAMWNGTDQANNSIPSGFYITRILTSDNILHSGSIIKLK